MELSAAEVWSEIVGGARASLTDQACRTWLDPLEAVAISQDMLIVHAPSLFAAGWVEDKYAELLAGIAERRLGHRIRISVRYQGGDRPSPPSLTSSQLAHAAPDSVPAAPAHRPSQPRSEKPESVGQASPLNERYTFDRFVVGNNNQLAAAAAHAVAEAPARMYNPLFVYGGVGLGKTHLMHAVGHALLEREPGKRVVYLSSERFTNELVSAIQGGSMAEFRRVYRQIDLLLVDDIQFLEGKERTQEEFFHTFNALHDAQRQIIITSDRPPKEIGLEDRLVSRFEWGLVTDIKAPDLETRMAILRKKVADDGLEISDSENVLHFIARHCTSSVREIEGAVIKLLAYSSLTRREINEELAREALGITLRGGDAGRGSLTPEIIRRRVAEAWSTSAEALQSKRRTKDLTVPRQVAMYLIKELLDLSLVEIGKVFGGRDHSTVIHSVDKVREEMERDPAFRERVETIRTTLAEL